MTLRGMRYPEKLCKLIESRDTNQSRLARATGLAQTAISEMTRGERRPYADQALKIARALGVSLEYLVDDELDDPPKSTEDLSKEEFAVLVGFRAENIDAETAVRRMRTRPTVQFAPEHEQLPGGGEDRPGGESGPARKDAGKAAPKR